MNASGAKRKERYQGLRRYIMIQYVKTHPELALCEFYEYRGKQYRNLIPLCHDCHDRAHERMKYRKVKQVNEERW